jgi:hypothetical protein
MKTKHGTELAINENVRDVLRRSLLTKIAAVQKQVVIDKISKTPGIGIAVERDGSNIPRGYQVSNTKTSDGKYLAAPEEVVRLVEGLNRQEADMVTRAVSSYNRIFKAGATRFAVRFLINNPFRDVQEALFKTRKNSLLPPTKNPAVWMGREISDKVSHVGALAHALTYSTADAFGISTKTMEAFKRAGAGYGGAVGQIDQNVPIPFRLLPGSEQAKVAFGRVVALPFEAVAKVGEAGENMTRLAEFLRMKGAGATSDLAAYNARNITVDFNKMGDAGRVANQWIPFLNANAQGAMNSWEAFKDQPVTSVVRAVTMVQAPVLALYAWNKQFDNDKYIDPYIKQNYFYINTGGKITREGNPDIPIIYTIRKGETAKILAYPIESLLDVASKDDRKVRERVREWSPKSMATGVLAAILPPPIKVATEEAANYDLFRSRPIVPEGMKNVEPGAQFTGGTTNTSRRVGEATTKVAKALGAKYGLSPLRFEHVLKGLYPATGQFLEAADLVFAPDPKVPRVESDTLRKSEAFQPIVRAPSGRYNPDMNDAFDFKKKKDIDRGTPRHIFEMAYRLYQADPTPENKDRLRDIRKETPGDIRRTVIQKVNKELRARNLPSKQAAAQRLPRKMRRAFMADEGDDE